MTDTPHRSDEDLSAALDGEAGPEVEAHLASCPACRRRADELRAAVDAVRGLPPVAVSSSDRETAIATAISAADQPARTAPVVPLAERRARRAGSGASAVLAAAAAAILVVVALLGALVVGRSDRHDDDAAAPAADSSGGAEAQTSEDGAGASTDADGPSDLGDLGELSAGDNLLQFAERRGLPAPSSTAQGRNNDAGPEEDTVDTSTPPGADGTRCAPAVEGADPDLGRLLAIGQATFAGEPVDVLVFRVRQGDLRTRIYLVAPGDCTLRSVQSFAE